MQRLRLHLSANFLHTGQASEQFIKAWERAPDSLLQIRNMNFLRQSELFSALLAHNEMFNLNAKAENHQLSIMKSQIKC